MDPTLKVENENDDNDDSSDEEEGKTGSGAATGETPLGQKRKREKSSTSWVTMKTVFRWKQTGSVNVEHLLGCCDGSTAVELSKAQEILDTSGQLVCVLCNIPISANKKCVKRHQTKNRKHLNFLLDLANGNRVLNIANTMAVAANIPVTGSSAKSPGAPSTPLPASGSSASATKAFADPYQSALAGEAWEILKNAEKIIDIEKLTKLLETLGVYDGKDLVYCEEKEIREIASTLKKVPQRRFNEIFGIQPE